MKGPEIQIITANRLGDGAVVYLAADGAWTATPDRARRAIDAAGAQRLADDAEIAVARQLVVGPYLIAVSGPEHRPERLRERIRSAGPTIGFGGSEVEKEA